MGIGNATPFEELQVGLRVIEHGQGVFERAEVFGREPARADRLLHLERNALFTWRQALEHLGADDKIQIQGVVAAGGLSHDVRL